MKKKICSRRNYFCRKNQEDDRLITNLLLINENFKNLKNLYSTLFEPEMEHVI